MKKIKHSSIEEALQDGYKLHGFTSGGRLRVLTLEKGKQTYYGEGVDFYAALRILGDDVIAGGRKYKDVYGEGKIEPAYWTGRYPDNGDAVDTWFYQGHDFDVIWEDGQIVVKLVKKNVVRTPKLILSTVIKWGKKVKWKFKEYDNIYVSSLGDRGGCTTTSDDTGSDPWFKKTPIEGRAHDLSVAMINAFAQTEKELEYEILD